MPESGTNPSAANSGRDWIADNGHGEADEDEEGDG